MVQARCIQKFRDKNNNIKGYLLEDCNGRQLRVTPDQLKMAIFSKQIEIVNLTLTKDGRLIDTNTKKNSNKATDISVNDKTNNNDNLINTEIKNKIMEVLKERIPKDITSPCYIIRSFGSDCITLYFYAVTTATMFAGSIGDTTNRTVGGRHTLAYLMRIYILENDNRVTIDVKTVYDYKERENKNYESITPFVWLENGSPLDYIVKSFDIHKDTFEEDIKETVYYIHYRLKTSIEMLEQMRKGQYDRHLVSFIEGERLQYKIDTVDKFREKQLNKHVSGLLDHFWDRVSKDILENNDFKKKKLVFNFSELYRYNQTLEYEICIDKESEKAIARIHIEYKDISTIMDIRIIPYPGADGKQLYSDYKLQVYSKQKEYEDFLQIVINCMKVGLHNRGIFIV